MHWKTYNRLLVGLLISAAVMSLLAAVTEEWSQQIGLIFLGLGMGLLLLGVISVFLWGTKAMAEQTVEQMEAMAREEHFFSELPIAETEATLKEKLLRQGFREEDGYLLRKRFSLWRDHVMEYAVLLRDQPVLPCLDRWITRMESKEKRGFLDLNRVVYLVSFRNQRDPDEMDKLQNYIANVLGLQGIPRSNLDSIVPVIYERDSQTYLLRLEKKWKARGFDFASRAFRKLVFCDKET